MERALIATARRWSLIERSPRPRGDWVRVRVAMAGLCRTDIQAMLGLRAVSEGRILGHEAAGTIEHIPEPARLAAQARGLSEGTRVAFFPFLPCGQCDHCQAGKIEFCANLQAVGLECDGAFANTVDLPPEVLFKAPNGLPWRALAYAEPVAAALGVWNVQALAAARTVGVVGRGRIAALTHRVLGMQRAPAVLLDPEDDIPANSFDVLVETWPTQEVMARCANGLRPGGTLIVKSRPAHPVPWPHQAIALKRLLCQGAPYGSFAKALSIMADGSLDIGDMLGATYPFTEQGITQALADEQAGNERQGKLFFRIDPCAD